MRENYVQSDLLQNIRPVCYLHLVQKMQYIGCSINCSRKPSVLIYETKVSPAPQLDSCSVTIVQHTETLE